MTGHFKCPLEVPVKRIGAAKFKEQCLSLLERLDPEGLIITKRGRPIARVIPLGREPAGLIGALRGKIEVRGDILSTGTTWDADAEP
jgi:antitoxin (DNA-binding transcriptional repressor) of toxin-antitoxin stability system